MGTYQRFRGNSENKLFYLIDGLYGGINTEYSDDVSQNGEFRDIVNFELDKRGCLSKRKGFGKLSAISQILNLLGVENLPEVRLKTEDYTNPENTNDNIVYMKLLKNDNNCFRNLSAFNEDKGYRKYQEMYGFQNNEFKLFMITTNISSNTSTAWLIKCKLPQLEVDGSGNFTDTETIEVSIESETLKVIFPWDRNLINIDTLEYFNKIYFLENNSGIMVYNRASETLSEGITYGGFYIHNGEAYDLENGAYKPTGLEVANIGFNVLGGDRDKSPLYWIDTTELETNSIQGLVLLSEKGVPLKNIPYSTNFKVAIIYTGTIPGENDLFTVEMHSSVDNLDFKTAIQITATYNEELSVNNSLAVYDIVMPVVTENFVQLTIKKTDSTIDPLYAYYSVSKTNAEDLPVERLSLEGYKVIDFYSRALYYKDNLLWFSDLNNFTYIPHYNRFELPLEPTDKIVKIVFFRNVHIVFTRYKIYKIYGDDPFASDFSITILNDSLGCCAANSVVQIENVLYFASDRGIYSLVSNYVSSSSITFENVKELDDKVKTLTSNFTYKIGDIDGLSMRYNGISDRAVGVRYKDKYLLFYNTSFEKGDYAAENNIDVLSYNYDLKAFTTNRFKYKPTFLFMVDNVIETYATYPTKPTYDSEEVVLNYDLSDNSTDSVVDLSGNEYNPTLVGGVKVSPGRGVSLSGDDSYLDVDTIELDATNGLDISVDTNIIEAKDFTFFDLEQTEGVDNQKTRGTLSCAINTSGGEPILVSYTLNIDYVSTPNFKDKTAKVEYTASIVRASTLGVSHDLDLTVNYKISDSNKVLLEVPNTLVSFPSFVGESSTVELGSGEFTVDYTGNEYSDDWVLDFEITRKGTETTYTKGDSTSGNVSKYTEEVSWTKIGYSWKAVPYDGFSRVTISKVYFQCNYDIYQSYTRNIIVTVNDTDLKFPIEPYSGTGKYYSSTDSRYVDIKYSSGAPKIKIAAKYNLAGTLNGTSYPYLNIATQTITLPSITEQTNEIDIIDNNSSTTPINFYQLVDSAVRFKLDYKGATDSLVFYLTSALGNIEVLSNNNVGIMGKHQWSVSLYKIDNSYYCSLKKDNATLVELPLMDYTLTKLKLDSNYIGVDKDLINFLSGSIYNFKITTLDIDALEFTFTEGKGETTKDIIKGVNATLLNCTWILIDGTQFNGINGYMIIPELPSSVSFTNGFMIEFSMITSDYLQVTKILDLAKSYGVESSGNKKCNIYVGLENESITFGSTGLTGNSFKLINNIPLDGLLHTYKFTVEDTGSDYLVSLYVDETLQPNTLNVNYKCISNTNRESNFIGRSNTIGEDFFTGSLGNLVIKTYETSSAISYEPAIFEYDTSHDEFERPMSIYLKTKAYNLDYPQHVKKLKKVFIKLIGGYNYSELYFTVYKDGFRVNDLGEYVAKVGNDGTIVYEYITEENLKIEASASRLDLLELDNSKLGEMLYQIDEFAIPAKGRNFSMEFSGESSDNFEVENIGIVCKLGKVKKS